VLLLALSTAGCFGATPAPAAAPVSSSEFRTPTFDETTGAIDGSVLDDQLRPVADAFVFLARSERNTTSDELGRFGFSNLPAEEDVLVVQHPLFEPAQQRLKVVAGELASLQILLTPLPSDEPFHLSQLKDGIVGCYVAFRGAMKTAQNCGTALALAGQTDQSVLKWTLAQSRETVSHLVAETSWKSQTPVEMFWSVDCSGEVGALIWTAGKSIHKSEVNETQVHSYLGNATKSCVDFEKACPVLGCKLSSQTWGSTEPLFVGAPQEVSYTYQQRFSQALTEFHNLVPAKDFSAFPDG
jgi:hypothetical protein